MGVSLPAGLHAKALVDYCLTSSMEQGSDMLPDHSCCLSEDEDAAHQDCESIFLCTCHIDQAPLSDQNWTITNKVFTGMLAVITSVSPASHTADSAKPASSTETYSTPPIFLLNSTFLN